MKLLIVSTVYFIMLKLLNPLLLAFVMLNLVLLKLFIVDGVELVVESVDC